MTSLPPCLRKIDRSIVSCVAAVCPTRSVNIMAASCRRSSGIASPARDKKFSPSLGRMLCGYGLISPTQLTNSGGGCRGACVYVDLMVRTSKFEPLIRDRALEWRVTCGVNDAGKLVRESHPPHFLRHPGVSTSSLGEILSFGLWMSKQGYRESTVQPCARALKAIAKRTNLLNPESVKTYLSSVPSVGWAEREQETHSHRTFGSVLQVEEDTFHSTSLSQD